MGAMKNSFIAFLLFLAIDFASAASAPSATADSPELQSHRSNDPVTCGSTLTGKIYTLSGDLDCSNATAPITIRDRAVLDLNNRLYVGPIILDGRRAQLRNGTIQCILAGTNGGPLDDDRCVRVEGEGRHTVQNVLITYESMDGFGIGIWVLSNNNFLANNTFFQTPDTGVFVIGNNNILQQNRAIISNFGAGFYTGGEGNQLIGNYATSHHAGYVVDGENNLLIQNVDAGVPDDISVTDEGFGIAGSGNRLTRNVVTNENFGIFVFTGSNTIENNIAIRNGFDLLDGTKDCSNIWQNNIFETSNQPCIGGTTTPLVSMNASETRALESFSALLQKLRKWNPQRGQKTAGKNVGGVRP